MVYERRAVTTASRKRRSERGLVSGKLVLMTQRSGVAPHPAWSRHTRRVVGATVGILAILSAGNLAADARARRPPEGSQLADTTVRSQLFSPHAFDDLALSCVGKPVAPLVVAERITRVWEEPTPACGLTGSPQTDPFNASVEYYTLFGLTVARATTTCGGTRTYCGPAWRHPDLKIPAR